MKENTNFYTVSITNGTIEDIIKCFIKSARIVFIVKDRKLVGAVTEGDVRRLFIAIQ